MAGPVFDVLGSPASRLRSCSGSCCRWSAPRRQMVGNCDQRKPFFICAFGGRGRLGRHSTNEEVSKEQSADGCRLSPTNATTRTRANSGAQKGRRPSGTVRHGRGPPSEESQRYVFWLVLS